MTKIKKKLLSLICLLSIVLSGLIPVQASAYSSIKVPVKMTKGVYKVITISQSTSYHVVNTNVLNVRMTPNTKYAPIKKLNKGTKVKVVGVSGNWFEIETIHKHNSHYDTKGYYVETGEMWVQKDYLTRGNTPIYLNPYRAYDYTCLEK